MARPKKTSKGPKQDPPVAYRPGADLAQIVAGLARQRNVGEHEMHKRLATLAAVGMDVRHLDLLAELSNHLTGPNAYVRAALHTAAAIATTARLDTRYAVDPARTALIIDVVRRQVSQTGGSVRPEVIQQLERTFGFNSLSVDSTGDDWQVFGETEDPLKNHLG